MSKLWIMLALYFATTDAHFQFRDAGDRSLSISRRRITRSPFRDAKSLAFNFTMPEYARSLLIPNFQFRDAGKRSLVLNRSLSILQRHKSFTLYFVTPEIADSQFRDARNRSHSISRQRKLLTLYFAMLEIARSLFRYAGSLALNFAMPEIARSLFCFAGNRSLSILRCQKSFALYFATTEIAHFQFHDTGNRSSLSIAQRRITR
jgi:hypothetical protein